MKEATFWAIGIVTYFFIGGIHAHHLEGEYEYSQQQLVVEGILWPLTIPYHIGKDHI